MRRLIPALAIVVMVLNAPAVLAAPTCQNRNGDTVHCNAPGAMPLGWALPPQEFFERQTAKAPEPGPRTLLATVLGIALFLVLIALLPEFDGSRAQDWGRQEDDDDPSSKR